MFKDRFEAGRKLAERLEKLHPKKILLLAIPRGGVIIGQEMAKKLKVPLDVLIIRKIGAPGNLELAIGAVGPGGVETINESSVRQLGVETDYLRAKINDLRSEILEREKKFRQGKKRLEIKGKTIILVDDGIATGSTVEAAVFCLRKKGAKKIILAVPVASREAVERLRPLVEEMVVLETPLFFEAVGQFYREFPQVTDEEVIAILKNKD